MLTKSELRKLKVQELRDELTSRGLDSAGTKPVLLERLESAMDASTMPELGKESEPNSVTDDGVDEDLLAEVMKGEGVIEPVLESKGEGVQDGEAVVSTSGGKEVGEDGAVAEAQGTAKHEPIVFQTEFSITKELTKDMAPTQADDAGDAEKKKERAKRFGLFDADLEEEKRKTRARRFGIPVAEDEVLKLKARAKRFGLPIPEEEAAKKKQRAVRFGMSPLAGLSEAEKLKQRAERFK
ncbi:hypothetical protein BSKO_08463 [Bryopsis sp. KO-2023]|nr:hypothetical protein BSKO_08463 [Bryopsis sp. KO-2023]